MEIKQSTAFRAPVILDGTSGVAVTGKAFSAVTCYIQKQAGTSTVKNVTANDWWEIDATNGPGAYDLLLSTGDTDTLGYLKYFITVSGAVVYRGVVEIVANLEADTMARLGAPAGASIAADIATRATAAALTTLTTTVGTPAGASVSADVAAVKSDAAAVKLKTDTLPATPANEVTVAAISTKLGTPAGASVSADILEALEGPGVAEFDSSV